MRTRTLKRLLLALTVLLLAGAGGVVVFGVKLPIDVPDVQDQSTAAQPTVQVSQTETRRTPELASLQQLAKKDLRQRLFDPPPKPKVVTPPKPPPSIRLLGTIVNAHNPQAMIAGVGGKTELKRIGDTVGAEGNTAVIQGIFTDHITVEHEGQTLDIPIAKSEGASRGASRSVGRRR